MPPIHAHSAPVPRARGSEITDEMLSATIDAASRIEAGQHSDADAALFMVVSKPAMEELLQWRRRVAMAREFLADDNVLMFPGARG